VVGSGNALLEIHQPWLNENWMRMRIHESGQHYTSPAVVDLGALRFRQSLYLAALTRSDDLPLRAQHRRIANQPDLAHGSSAAWTRLGRLQGDKLADVSDQQ